MATVKERERGLKASKSTLRLKSSDSKNLHNADIQSPLSQQENKGMKKKVKGR